MSAKGGMPEMEGFFKHIKRLNEKYNACIEMQGICDAMLIGFLCCRFPMFTIGKKINAVLKKMVEELHVIGTYAFDDMIWNLPDRILVLGYLEEAKASLLKIRECSGKYE